MKKVLLAISSAPNKDSNSAVLLEHFCEGAEFAGVRVERVFLYDLSLSYFNYGNRRAEPPDESGNKDVRTMEKLIMGADGLVIAAPVWNFSIPAVLKNLLDRMSYFALVYKKEGDVRKTGSLNHLNCFYIMTTGAQWFAWIVDRIAYLQLKRTMWYFGAKNRGLLKAHHCGNGSQNVVKDRPNLLKKAYREGVRFGKVLMNS